MTAHWGGVPDRRVLALALTLMVTGVMLFSALARWSARQLGLLLGSFAIFAGVGLFALGWVLVGAGLRPRGSARRGALFAASLYIAVGALWTTGFVLVNPWGTDFSQTNLALFLGYSIFLWPFVMAFVFGLFGLSPS